jgi:hypothetical protein
VREGDPALSIFVTFYFLGIAHENKQIKVIWKRREKFDLFFY